LRIAFFTDAHNADLAPRMRKESYTQDLIDKQEIILKKTKKYDLIICGGDVFHSKRSERISYRLSNKLLEIYREFPKLLIVVGNHDLEGSDVFGERPIGLFAKLPNCNVILSGIQTYDDCIFVCVGGGEFFKNEEIVGLLKKYSKETMSKGFPVSAVVHAPLTSLSFNEYPFEIIPFKDVTKLFPFFMIGHLHDYQICNERIAAPGGLSRGVLNFDLNMERRVGFISIDLVDGIFKSTFEEIKVKPYGEVFKMEKKISEVKTKEAIESFSGFVSSLDIPKAMDAEKLIEHISKMDLDDKIKIKAVSILKNL